MAEVHHIHETGVDRADSGVAMLVFTVIAILAVAAFAFFAFNGTFFRTVPATTTPAGTNVDVQGTINTPTPSTNQGGTTNTQY